MPSINEMTGAPTTGAPVFSKSADQSGSIIIYIFVAIGLLAALTYSFVNSSRENVTTQIGYRAAEDLGSQAMLIKSVITGCVLEFSRGGIDLNGDGIINSADNPPNLNFPYPVNPTLSQNPHGVSADNRVENVTCTYAPHGQNMLFRGGNVFLAPIPAGFSDWIYTNNASGVYFETTAPNSAAGQEALRRAAARFPGCSSEIIDSTLRIWLLRKNC